MPSSSASYETLLLERDGGVAKLTLNRPDAANALDMTMGRELNHASIALDEDESVRAVLLTGNGQDVLRRRGPRCDERSGRWRHRRIIKELASNLHLAISHFARMRAPVI